MGCGSSSAAGAGADVPTAAKPVDSQPTQQDTAGADATEAKKNDPSVAAPAPEESAAASSPPQAEVPVEKEAAPEAQAAAPEEAAPESAPAVVEPVAEVAAAADPVPVDAPAADAPVDAPVEADAPAAAEPAAESAAVSEPVSSPVEETPVTVVSTDGASSKSVKPQAVFVLGGPGSGKGTQCANIVKEYGWVHLSAGDLLRDERKKGGERAVLIEEYIVQGRIVPAELTVSLLKSAIESHVAEDRTQFLIDGFPRNVDNLSGWKKVMGSYVELLFVLFFDCSEEAMQVRLLDRGITSGRSDDNEVAIKKRFETYSRESRPVIERYEKTGRAVKIDANVDADTVWSNVKDVFAKIDRDTVAMPKVVDGVVLPRSEPQPQKPQAVFVLGGPAAGTTVQCENIAREYGWVNLSAADLIAAERAKGDASEFASQLSAAGSDAVPADLTVSVLKSSLTAHVSQGRFQFLLVDFPQNASELAAWKHGAAAEVDVLFVLFFDGTEAVLQQRLVADGIPEEDASARIAAYAGSTKAEVIDKYQVTGRAVKVDADAAPDLVWESTKAIFANINRDTAPLPKIVVQ